MFILEAKYSTNLPQVAYSAQQVKQYEGEAALMSGTNLSQLMLCAGQALFSLFDHELVTAQRVLLLAGKGNNAGDAYVLAKLLHQAGREVCIYAVCSPEQLLGDARQAYLAASQCGVNVVAEQPELAHFCVIVDGVFGTGFKGQLSPQLITLFNDCKNTHAKRVSIDIPSGVNGTSSVVSKGAFVADITMTFIALKQGMLTGPAKAACGQLLYASLDVAEAFNQIVHPSVTFLASSALFNQLERRAVDSYKNSCGHVLVIGGNKGMAGAVRLAAEAALRSGAGLVSVATHPDNVTSVIQGRYELMVHGINKADELAALIKKADVVVIGPGLSQNDWAQVMFEQSFSFKGPIVVDADALNLLAKSDKRYSHCVLTPHHGEAKRLLAKNQDIDPHSRFELASWLVSNYNATVVLKGPGSLVADKKCVNINRSGSSAMASAGMGDVLSGIIGALIGQGMEPFAASTLAVYIHGLAAQIAAKEGERGLLASDLFVHIRRLLG
ncbi:bifunctional ADP-dependent NAD(P)H-hydrate dehydratase/NAD(P)H-hydrate epimerase [Pseudoalteromonas byunsanensis]|uniref:Bifunctional NAD(P)H-hydrate repair enzyme n=1 Tax=Pseudoalteromonas byunsanensis TaxID=327939 RepID=A0A1S1NGS9_9GAMM|nr:bifunctional ADP-dependent NAD(P)H-hydrate dehydratase/NAD(P)H-hydrate epimerase [Pseudoalteromonas byunsanensis]OHU97736.1 bifunctional ADP-dependent (S)-NAD(P)H-hydrate dehydratase/NAD(P)H-hydrate epimerase [Pseudoalteromonas byunsanensis]